VFVDGRRSAPLHRRTVLYQNAVLCGPGVRQRVLEQPQDPLLTDEDCDDGSTGDDTCRRRVSSRNPRFGARARKDNRISGPAAAPSGASSSAGCSGAVAVGSGVGSDPADRFAA
jgi:hypothetical protein